MSWLISPVTDWGGYYEHISGNCHLMIAFGILVATIFLALNRPRNEPNIVCGPIFKYKLLRDEPTLRTFAISFSILYRICQVKAKPPTSVGGFCVDYGD